MPTPRLSITALLALTTVLAPGLTACYDESDACRDYCVMAADCLDCGGNISLDQCQDDCVNLSISQQRALANCAKDCPNVLACQQMVGFPPPSPCVY